MEEALKNFYKLYNINPIYTKYTCNCNLAGICHKSCEICGMANTICVYPEISETAYLNLTYILCSNVKQWSFKSCHSVEDFKWIVISNLNWEAKQNTEFFRTYKERIKKLI